MPTNARWLTVCTTIIASIPMGGRGADGQEATAKLRRWTDTTGRFSIEADFVRVAADKVELKRADGSVISVPLARLSEADRGYVRELQNESAAPPPKPPHPELKPRPGPKQRPAPKPGTARSASQALKQKVEADYKEVPLRDALRELAEQAGANVVLDERSLDGAGIDPRRPVTARLAGTLDAALELLLKDAGLAHLVRHDVVFVTTAEAAAEEYHQTRVYKLKRAAPLDALVADIQRNVAPESWDEAGGSGSLAPLAVGAVVIVQSAAVHRDVESRYGKLLLPAASPVGWGRPVSVEFVETPLSDALDVVARQLKVVIRIDKPALDEVGVADHVPVSLTVSNVPAGSVLSLLTEGLALEWKRDKAAILVTTPERLEASAAVINYDVRGLSLLPDCSDLIDAVQHTVAPANWEDVGGAGTIGLAAPGQIAVRQSDDVHRQVEMLLAALRAR